MSPTHDEMKRSEHHLHHLLVTLILVADGYHWPGADGMMTDDLLREYANVAREGRVPGREELCRRHPELAHVVADFFDCFRSTI